jgi:Ca-activated chloride channel family protein
VNVNEQYRIADCGLRIADSRGASSSIRNPKSEIRSRRSRFEPCLLILALSVLPGPSLSLAATGSARELLRQGDRLYGDNEFAEAVNKYNDALVEQPQAAEPKFNKANSYYRLDDLSEAMDLYQQVAAESKDMALVAKAKYNLGNCYFQRGTKQRDSNLQKALEDMQTSIAQWRQVLDLDPQGQQKQQQQNQGQQQNQSQPPPDPNQPQKTEPKPDPNQTRQEQKPEQGQQNQPQQAKAAPDATAREILDHEQRQKKERELLRQRGQYQEVEKDW